MYLIWNFTLIYYIKDDLLYKFQIIQKKIAENLNHYIDKKDSCYIKNNFIVSK